MNKNYLFPFLWVLCLGLNSCASYRIATNSQEGSELQTYKAASMFWGLVAKPPLIPTPLCDNLQSPGMSEVRMRRNVGQGLVSVVTLGIYNPVTIEYKCSKKTD